MGNCAEICAEKYDITREAQDNYAIDSYKKSKNSIEQNIFSKEIDDIALLWGVFILFSKMDGKLACVIDFIAERKIEENVVL